MDIIFGQCENLAIHSIRCPSGRFKSEAFPATCMAGISLSKPLLTHFPFSFNYFGELITLCHKYSLAMHSMTVR